MRAREAKERVDRILQRFVGDLRQQSAALADALDGTPEVRAYLDGLGAASIRDLSPAQMRELTDVVFKTMKVVLHPDAN